MAVFKRGNVYCYHFFFNGEHIQRSTKQGNIRVARQMEAAHKTRLAKGEVGIEERKPAPTLKVFAQDFEKEVEIRNAGKPATIQFYKTKLRHLLKFSSLASARLDRIDAYLISQYIQHRREKVTEITVNRELATLRRMLHIAAEWNLIPRVPRIELLRNERQRTFVLTHSDEQRYLALLEQPLNDAALLMLDTGLRVGEVVKLQWADIQFEPLGQALYGFLVVREGKSKYAQRAVPLTARAKAMLEQRRKAVSSTWVFPGNSPQQHILVTSLDHLHAEAARPVVSGKMICHFPKEFVLHSLRHTMLTRLGESGAEAFTIQKIAGHSSVTVSQRYVHPTSQAVERAFQRLELYNLENSELRSANEILQLPATVSATLESELAVNH